MNADKISFIMCVNEDTFLEEAVYYIDRLEIPDGFDLDLITIYDAKSMTAGYNEGMRSTDAKYKIYMHQDVFILRQSIIKDILAVFEDPTIGMTGVAGCVGFPENGIIWNGRIHWSILENDFYKTFQNYSMDVQKNVADAVTIDGMFIATQYDIEWREDLFTGWDFYDVSQSFEFRRKGYRTVLPFEAEPWLLHYDGRLNMKNYYRDRKIFLENYKEDIETLEHSFKYQFDSINPASC